MKFFVIAAISISLYAPASAGQSVSALGDLLNAAGPAAESVQAVLPGAPAAASPLLSSGLSDLDSAQAADLSAAARSAGFSVLELDGNNMKTKPALMDYTARTLAIPDDMDNWDAMIDDLGDLPTFRHNSKVLVIVKNASAIQNADAKLYAQLRNVFQLSCQNASEWSRSTATLKFVFVP